MQHIVWIYCIVIPIKSNIIANLDNTCYLSTPTRQYFFVRRSKKVTNFSSVKLTDINKHIFSIHSTNTNGTNHTSQRRHKLNWPLVSFNWIDLREQKREFKNVAAIECFLFWPGLTEWIIWEGKNEQTVKDTNKIDCVVNIS